MTMRTNLSQKTILYTRHLEMGGGQFQRHCFCNSISKPRECIDNEQDVLHYR